MIYLDIAEYKNHERRKEGEREEIREWNEISKKEDGGLEKGEEEREGRKDYQRGE